MADRLAGKVALVTGGARGQGAAEATLFAEEGCRVLVGDVRDGLGEQLAADLQGDGFDIVYAHLDVTSEADWAQALELAQQRFGRLDVLVNNAGVVAFAGVAETTDDEWLRVIAVNQTGVFYGMRAAIPVMRLTGGGSIINISSTFGIAGVPGYFAYQASKGAVLMMTRAAAVDCASQGIRVNAICPGLILTDMTAEESPEMVETGIQQTPLKRGGEPLEVAYGALYLASEESAFVTGTELVIDGGYLAQ